MGFVEGAAPRDVDDAVCWTGELDGPVGVLTRVVDADDVATALTAFGLFVAGNSFVVCPSTTRAVAPAARHTRLPPVVIQAPGVKICPLIL
jgi:hypothetical protein